MKRSTTATLAAAALILAVLAAGMGRKPPERRAQKEGSMTDVSNLAATDVTPSRWSGSYSGRQDPGVAVVADAESWQDLWKNAFSKEAPAVDFNKYFAVAAFAGLRNTGGYSVEFLPPVSDGSSATIPWRVRAPGKGAFVTMAFTQPFAIQLYRKTPLAVKTVEER
jgi:hypothetical protein